ncbi:DNA-binding protein [Aerococcaceae bacterium 50-4]
MTDLPKIGKPATAALATVGVDQVEQLTHISKTNLAKLHGVGPKAISILEDTLSDLGLSFTSEASDWPDTPFFLIGDLSCDNAPKRRIARDLAVGLYAKDFSRLDALLTDDLVYMAPYSNLTYRGKDQVKSEFVGIADISSMEVFQILSHGKEAALHGKITDKRGATTYFSMFFVFAGHKKDSAIREIVHYQQNQ